MPKTKKIYRAFLYGWRDDIDYNNNTDIEQHLIDVVDFADKRQAEAFCMRHIKDAIRGNIYKNHNNIGEIYYIDLHYGEPFRRPDDKYAMKKVEYVVTYSNDDGTLDTYKSLMLDKDITEDIEGLYF